ALAQLIPTKLRTHIYISNVPVFLTEDSKKRYEILNTLKLFLKDLGKKNSVNFVRIDPLLEDNEMNNEILSRAGYVKAPTHVQAEHKWILNIQKDEEVLLSEMKKDTRYEVRKSLTSGLDIGYSTNPEDFDIFYDLFELTRSRQKFVANPKEYLQKQFEVLSKDNIYRLYFVKYNEKVIASALIAFYGDTAFYLHASSLNEREINKLYAPHALIWQAIKDAKKDELKYFDFWGVAPDDDPKHPWAGFTHFKKGFGGELFKTVRAYDIPLSIMYSAIYPMEKYRDVWGYFYGKLIGRS
ncbi:MAG TPA: peptidoglycan bridge formation glycyltransferase FemA/FemB family protein, partial [Candidatus Dojkabacteria bacterium]|nr:peptidoglycan bridge formation glycyltransferase FemA/FemB family protein [Candidatus Dojkabacteria bacterium]